MDHPRIYKNSIPHSPQAEAVTNQAIVLFGEVLADVFPDTTMLGGAPFNVARHLGAFRQKPLLISRLGSDRLGEEIFKVMTQSGMDLRGMQIDTHNPTGQVLVHLENDGHHFEILPLQAYDAIDSGEACGLAHSANPTLIYFGTLSQRYPASRQTLKTLLQTVKAGRFLDLNLRAPWYTQEILHFSLEQANIVKLNADELATVARMFAVSDTPSREQARTLMRMFALEQMVVTCGDQGVWLIDAEGQTFTSRRSAGTVKIVDTVGAGDAFSAVLILGMAADWSIQTSLERANSFAAAVCEIRGAIPEHADFYQPFIEEWKL